MNTQGLVVARLEGADCRGVPVLAAGLVNTPELEVLRPGSEGEVGGEVGFEFALGGNQVGAEPVGDTRAEVVTIELDRGQPRGEAGLLFQAELEGVARRCRLAQ